MRQSVGRAHGWHKKLFSAFRERPLERAINQVPDQASLIIHTQIVTTVVQLSAELKGLMGGVHRWPRWPNQLLTIFFYGTQARVRGVCDQRTWHSNCHLVYSLFYAKANIIDSDYRWLEVQMKCNGQTNVEKRRRKEHVVKRMWWGYN